MKLRVIYRSSASENSKNRPQYYSKLLALVSFVRALDALPENADVHYVNDGPIPSDRLAVMQATGRLIQVDGGSNRASFVRAAALPRKLGWPREDLVWFAEDDYLYHAQSMKALVAAAEALQQVDYFGLYGSVQLDSDMNGRSVQSLRRRTHEVLLQAQQPDASEGGNTFAPVWYRADSTTSTFGVRAGAAREDEDILRLCPYTGGAWDATTSLTCQGVRPFDWKTLLIDLTGKDASGNGRPHRSFALVPNKAAINVRASLRRRRLRRVLVCAKPSPATHLEEPFVAPGTDWGQVVQDVKAWGRSRDWYA